MNETEMIELAEILADYLEENKVFFQNPERMAEVNVATEIACQLFPDAEIGLDDDPLQMRAIILTIKDFDLVVRETEMFAELISKANNFEIIYRDDKVELAILFRDALIRI